MILAEKIFEQALNLAIDERLALIDSLINSTNLSIREDIDYAWSKEVERRCQELGKGNARLISGEKVFEKIKKRFATLK